MNSGRPTDWRRQMSALPPMGAPVPVADDSYRTVIATLSHEVVIRDFADCSLHVSITGGRRRCVWHVYSKGGLEMLLDWFLMELDDHPYSID